MTEEKRICPFSLSAEGIKKSGCYCIEEKCMAWDPTQIGKWRVDEDSPWNEYIEYEARCKLIPKEPKQD
jgi:hypothetical protein